MTNHSLLPVTPDAKPVLSGVIDWHQLNATLPSQSAVLRILDSLIKLHQHTPTELMAAFESNNWQTIKDIAHKMRGTASLLSVPNLLSSAKIVEQEILENQFVESSRVHTLATAIDALLTEAQGVLNARDNL